eukprot:CAMPEP_0196589676 /NCGR_PEP_ID=MMETSP1081-20130531/64286_1 /TAXON_ID=36882 /ORGANISM="Pyramimonas amylifera, Strain CCMP720" /LENGTH=198 /DNA_ID=CAMNT_0041912541 /DNA_START=226 /DNA_END=822 /DNA_ORIENTATION=+
MGRDKFENEDLIKYGLPEDVWFHVDKLSSAHVYVRLNKGETIEDIEKETLEDCAQLCKANSIQGNKKNNLDIVYTPWANLKKTASMDVGQVSFHNDKEVKKIKVESRCNEIINRLNKTKEEQYPDLQQEREKYDAECKQARQAIAREEKKQAIADGIEKKRLDELKSYSSVMMEESMHSNKDLKSKYKSVQDYEDDFM